MLTRRPDTNHERASRDAAVRYRAGIVLLLVVGLLPTCSSSAPPDDVPPDTPPVTGSDDGEAQETQQDTLIVPPTDSQDMFFEGSELRWLEARERGVTFRAVGQQPGWLLEMEGDRRIRLVTEYGAAELVTDMPSPAVDSITWTTTYRAVAEEYDLRIHIRDEPCADTMTGEPLPATVTIVLDGTRYHGCGRALDVLH